MLNAVDLTAAAEYLAAIGNPIPLEQRVAARQMIAALYARPGAIGLGLRGFLPKEMAAFETAINKAAAGQNITAAAVADRPLPFFKAAATAAAVSLSRGILRPGSHE